LGLTWDQGPEYATAEANLKAIKGLLTGNSADFHSLEHYSVLDRYHGVGFTLPAYLVEKGLCKNLPVERFFHVDRFSAMKLVGNPLTFLVFAASSIVALLILRRITGDAEYAFWGSLAWLLWPYLLGHGLMNYKDIPFTFAWMLCFHRLLIITGRYCSEGTLRRRDFFALGFGVAWLLSIRISGALFCVVIAIFAVLIGAHARRLNTIPVKPAASTQSGGLISLVGCLAVFLTTALAGMILLIPISWHDPRELLLVFSTMSHYPWMGGTLTAGESMQSNQLPVFRYLLDWLGVKLPLVSLLGLAVALPAYRQSRLRLSPSQGIGWAALGGAPLLIMLALALAQVTLYDELRHVLFLPAMFFLCGLVGIYHLSRRFAFAALGLTLILFVADNINIYPFQYTWFNELTRSSDIGRYYETDYWGSSLRSLATAVRRAHPTGLQCVYSEPAHLFTPFMGPDISPCEKRIDELPSRPDRPFVAAYYTRDRALPATLSGCSQIAEVGYTPLFSTYRITLSRADLCR
jgi:hypothetical protein